MTNADTAPEEAHNEGIEDGRMTGIVLFTCVRARAASCMITLPGKPFLDGEPVLFCTLTKVSHTSSWLRLNN